MTDICGFWRNLLSCLISLFLHLGALFWICYHNPYNTLFSLKNENDDMLVINLDQISPTLNQENMQAVQNISNEPTLENEEETKNDIEKEEPKIDKKSPMITTPQPKLKKPKRQKSVKSSQNLADNKAINLGGTTQSGQSNSQNKGSASNILGQIHAQILKHKSYPKRAINSQISAVTKLEFRLKGRCDFEFLKVVKSSGHEYLDRHSLNIIKKACKDFPSDATGIYVKVPMNYNFFEITKG